MDVLLLGEAVSSIDSVAEAAGLGTELSAPVQIALLVGAMSFATAVLVSMTAFTRIIIVLSFVRRALSTQEIPPNQVVLGLSLFLTMYVMGPTFQAIYDDAITPLLEAEQNEEIDFGPRDAVEVTLVELKKFMLHNTRTSDLELFFELAEVDVPSTRLETPIRVVVPAFIISELKTAFIMGFCIYIPFLLIDLVVSTILMALGMMMMPPVIVSTPCKLLLFVLIDGWQLVTRALVESFTSI